MNIIGKAWRALKQHGDGGHLPAMALKWHGNGGHLPAFFFSPNFIV